ncbi:hypothetical protein GS501_09790 [Saccharibacter sp. 17.LH.SD]|uniref:YqgE/AlgH family protein n=1 Tax=Saccharibacter sp. 17.LH.SD TaxID=2689393 RepID=UPI00136ADD18|nr:YqgE/AlgH family protein [Saccharibacter sp. 17.LH.SD]MXV45319.1 hypothetical protein [Saccharibacter sp. 17.LH.SD]
MPFVSPNENLTGRLLVASPVLADTEFAQTVIYMCSHSAAGGAMGMIVNRRLTHPTMADLLKQLNVSPNPPERLFGLGVGGPVEPGRGFILHSLEWHGAESIKTGGLANVSASLDILKELASGGGPRRAVMLLGHSVWEAGQLEEEILRGNAWYVADANEELVFGVHPSRKWETALASLGVNPLSLTSIVGEA